MKTLSIYDEDDNETVIEYTISRYHPATGPDHSGPGEPAEGGEVEIFAAYRIDPETQVKAEISVDELTAAQVRKIDELAADAQARDGD